MNAELLTLVDDILPAVKEATVSSIRKFELRYSFQRYCPRWHYYAHQDGYFAKVEKDLRGECILETGTSMHAALQARFLKVAGERDDFEFLGFIDEDGKYVEYEFLSHERPSGHSDGLIRYKGRYGVLEIKSAFEQKLELMREPIIENVVQSNCYAKEFTRLGFNIEFIWLLYMERNQFDGTKSFMLDPQLHLADNYVSLVDYGKSCIEAGCLPEGICCTGPKDYNFCPHVERCWADKNPLVDVDPAFRLLAEATYGKAEPPKHTHLLRRVT